MTNRLMNVPVIFMTGKLETQGDEWQAICPLFSVTARGATEEQATLNLLDAVGKHVCSIEGIQWEKPTAEPERFKLGRV